MNHQTVVMATLTSPGGGRGGNVQPSACLVLKVLFSSTGFDAAMGVSAVSQQTRTHTCFCLKHTGTRARGRGVRREQTRPSQRQTIGSRFACVRPCFFINTPTLLRISQNHEAPREEGTASHTLRAPTSSSDRGGNKLPRFRTEPKRR